MKKKLITLHTSFEQTKTLKKFNNLVLTEKIEDIAPAKIPIEAVKTPEKAIAIRTLALNDIIGLEEHNKVLWQQYWLKCCLSEKCDYVFSILSVNGLDISREKDLIQIIKGNIISKCLSDEAKKYYLTTCIDFLLKRYNLVGACRLFFDQSGKINWNLVVSWNLFKVFFPRMLSSILVGIILIASSQELMDFSAKISQSSFFYYSLIFIFLLSFSYFFFECCDVIRGSLPKNHLNSKIIFRIIPILLWGFGLSTIFSYVLTSINLLYSDLSPKCNFKLVLFYASFSFFIGILIQLLWEDKTVTEPL